MKFLIPLQLLIASALAQDACGFPDGPECESLGEGPNGLEQFPDDGCCLLPLRCGNEAGLLCERVAVDGADNDADVDNGDQEEEVVEDDAADDGAAQEEEADAGADDECGFPNGPDCESIGVGDNGLEQFVDDGCCLLPFRCGNTAGERCERVSA